MISWIHKVLLQFLLLKLLTEIEISSLVTTGTYLLNINFVKEPFAVGHKGGFLHTMSHWHYNQHVLMFQETKGGVTPS